MPESNGNHVCWDLIKSAIYWSHSGSQRRCIPRLPHQELHVTRRLLRLATTTAAVALLLLEAPAVA